MSSSDVSISTATATSVQKQLVGSGSGNFPAERDAAMTSLLKALIKTSEGNDIVNSAGFKAAESQLRAFNFSSVPDIELDSLVGSFCSSVSLLVEAIPETLQTNTLVNLPLQKIKNLPTTFSGPLNMYVAAQKNIALGFHETLERTPDLPGIPFTIWSSKGLNSDNKDWGPVFAARVDYVQKHGGTITFFKQDVKTGHHITEATINLAKTLWSESKGNSIAERYQEFLRGYEEKTESLKGSTTSFELAYLTEKKIPFKFVEF
ncbi:MAG: hypothetical protein LBP65_03085 [Puniceicoccales bacterium]|jgi:hypothetical protein|nr:hypothetical protein [Puniceicoccales bacterium]